MSTSGFFLLSQRCDHSWLYESLVKFASCLSVKNIFSDSKEVKMVCPNSSTNCHSKLILYAAGLVLGGATIGFFAGQYLAKRRARCNYIVKLSTDKVSNFSIG